MTLGVDLYLLLGLVAILAGFLDTLAGGGGLIVIPTLLLSGLSPVQAIATNKLQGSFGTLTSATAMLKNKLINIDEIKKPFIFAVVGSVAGAITIQFIPASIVRIIVPGVLVLIALYFLLAPSIEKDRDPKVGAQVHDKAIVPAIGFYDGAIGPGAGSFYTLASSALRGKNLVKATATAKLLNFASNLAALVVFIIGGKIVWVTGLIMSIGTVIGAYLGSMVVVHGGAKYIKPVIVVMSLAMLANYGYQNFFGS